MSDTTSPASEARTSVVLDDGPTTPPITGANSGAAPVPGGPPVAGAAAPATVPVPAATTPPAGAAPAAKTPEQLRAEAEALVLDLGKRQRGLADREKALGRREERTKAAEELFSLAERDPLAFAERIAQVTRLDRAKLVEAWTVAGAGGTAKLTAEERVARLEAEREREREAAARREADAAKARDDAEADAAVARHVTDLKGLATAKAAEFPLVSRRLETGAVAAFDLMVLHHQAGQPISHEAALRLVEDQLRADAEADASLLGYAKQAGNPTSHAQPTAVAAGGSAPASGSVNSAHGAGASPAAGAAPFETAHVIKSDEDIARDWARMFRAA